MKKEIIYVIIYIYIYQKIKGGQYYEEEKNI